VYIDRVWFRGFGGGGYGKHGSASLQQGYDGRAISRGPVVRSHGLAPLQPLIHHAHASRLFNSVRYTWLIVSY